MSLALKEEESSPRTQQTTSNVMTGDAPVQTVQSAAAVETRSSTQLHTAAPIDSGANHASTKGDVAASSSGDGAVRNADAHVTTPSSNVLKWTVPRQLARVIIERTKKSGGEVSQGKESTEMQTG
jgi:hypothetical protein